MPTHSESVSKGLGYLTQLVNQSRPGSMNRSRRSPPPPFYLPIFTLIIQYLPLFNHVSHPWRAARIPHRNCVPAAVLMPRIPGYQYARGVACQPRVISIIHPRRGYYKLFPMMLITNRILILYKRLRFPHLQLQLRATSSKSLSPRTTGHALNTA